MNWKMFKSNARMGLGLLAIAVITQAVAQDEYEGPITDLSNSYDFKMIGGMAGRMEPHGNDLMGDMIDKNTGSISFEHTDVSVPGNSGLEVAVHRIRTQHYANITPYQQAFGDWELKLPMAYFSYGYDSADDHPSFNDGCLTNPGNIYRDIRKSAPVSGSQTVEIGSHSHRTGTTLSVPGKSLSGFQGDVLAGISDPKSDWVSGGQETDYAGRCAEVVIAPDGTKYKFGRHVFRKARWIEAPVFYQRIWNDRLFHGFVWVEVDKRYAVYLVTEVADVHGNWVRYEYTGARQELARIHSSDLREINIQYDSTEPDARNSRQATDVTYKNRSWNYDYDGGRLDKVTLPDDRYWEFDPSMVAMNVEPLRYLNCTGNEHTFSLKHPDGAVGSYTVQQTKHHKTVSSFQVDNDLINLDGDYQGGLGPSVSVDTNPALCYGGHTELSEQPPEGINYYKVISLRSKTILAPNVPDMNWTFGYSDVGLPIEENATQITEPDGTVRNYVYQKIGLDHGLLKRIEVSSPDGSSETHSFEYDTSQDAPESCHQGWWEVTSGACLNYAKRPQTKVTQSRDGTTYTTNKVYDKASDGTFVDEGRPNKITSKSTLQSDERITDIEYWHNRTTNIIGLPKRISKNDKEFVYYHYNTKGQPEYVNKFGARWDSFTYHPDGNLHTVTDPLLNTASLTDYHRGQPRLITRRDNTTLERTVDDNGWVTSETNGRGYTTSYGYTDGGWMNRITPPSPWEETNIVYHNLGSEGFYRTIRRGTKESVEWYDAMLRLRREGQQALFGGGLSTYVTTDYDALGRAIFTSLPSYSLNPTQGTSTSYDGLGRVTNTSENFGLMATTSTEYLSNNRVKITDPLNNVTITNRSGYGSPDDGQVTLIEQPSDVITWMDYDIYGNILSARQFHNYDDEASTQTWKYNDRLLPCVHHVPETGYKAFMYNGLDQVEQYGEGLTNVSTDTCLSSIPSSSRITMAYDELGRTEAINYPDTTPDVSIQYDANGNVERNERGGAIWDFDYNSDDRLEGEVLSIDGRSYALNYGYDTMGNLDSRILPSGRVIEFDYNGLGQVTGVESEGQDYASNINYHVNGLIANTRYGNGHTFTQTINDSQQPERLRSSLALVTAMDLDYDYDARRNVTSILDRVDRSRDRSMTYDGLGRLIKANGVWGAGIFSYDALGNLTRKTLGSRTVRVTYDETTNRAIQSTDTAGTTRAIDYDTLGNVTKLGALNFTYDKSNQPIQLTGSSSGTYKYDGKFKRVKVDVDGKVIYNVFDASGTLVHVDEVVGGTANISVCFSDCANVAVAGPQTTDYIKAGSVSIRLENDQPTYTHKDLLGSPVASTDARGNIIWQEHYTPYGEKFLRDAANDDQGSFTGHISDSATGLTYMQARYYDPVIGRFLSNDPVGFLGHLERGNSAAHGFGRYTYANNNPYKFTDPDGEFINFLIGAGVGAAVGALAEAGSQLIKSGGDFGALDPSRIAVAAGAGALVGIGGAAIGGFMAGGTATVATGTDVFVAASAGSFIGGSVSAGAQATNNAIDGNTLTDGVVDAALSGAVAGFAGAGAGQIAGNIITASTKLGAQGAITSAGKSIVEGVADLTSEAVSRKDQLIE